MPIRPDLRHFYGPEYRHGPWRQAMERAGGRFERGPRGGLRYLGGARCEECGKPDREVVEVVSSKDFLASCGVQWWRTAGRNWNSSLTWFPPPNGRHTRPRTIRVVLTVAHSNHTPGDDRDENLKALCQWCHLNYDKLHHKETRSRRKDASRPLLGVAS